MNEQEAHIDTKENKQSKKAPYALLGLLLGSVVLLVVVIGLKGMGVQVTDKTYNQEQALQTVQQVPQGQSQQPVSPVQIATKDDLAVQQNVLDSADMTSITAGLDQNSAITSQLSE